MFACPHNRPLRPNPATKIWDSAALDTAHAALVLTPHRADANLADTRGKWRAAAARQQRTAVARTIERLSCEILRQASNRTENE